MNTPLSQSPIRDPKSAIRDPQSTIDLLSFLLTLRPQPAPASPVLPTWWGRAAHALLLNVVRQYNPALAEALHDENVSRPFTVSTLMGRFPQGQLDQSQAYFLRFTAFEEELVKILLEAAQSGPLAPGAVIELDYHPFLIEALQPSPLPAPQTPIPDPRSAIRDPQSSIPNPRSEIHDPHSPWSALTSYQELSAPYLLGKIPAPRRIALQFTSPTTFKSGGMHVPIPLPELVFGSLLERWNAFAPIAFPPETRRYSAECLAVARYHLSSRVAPVKSGGVRVGGVGDISYTSLNYDRYWMSLAAVLAEFALFAGVGAGTSMGLGQCRVVDLGSRISDRGSRTEDQEIDA